MAGPSKVAVQMVLTLRDDRGQIVEMLHIPLVIKANWPSEIVHQINIDQSTIDLLAVMLTDRPPGTWDLEIDYPTNPHHEGGPIVSGLHRSSGDGVPSGCTPCRQEKT